MIVFAHLGHWYSAFGFVVPAGLVIGWIRLQTRRERRRVQFAERWTLELREGRWTLAAVDPAQPSSRRRRSAGTSPAPSPWSEAASELPLTAGNGHVPPEHVSASPAGGPEDG